MNDPVTQPVKRKLPNILRNLAQPVRNIHLRQGLAAFVATLKQCFQSVTAHQSYDPLREAFQSIFHFSPVAICLTRVSDGKFIDVNQAFLTLTGYERKEVIGQTSVALNIYVYSANRAEVLKKLQQEGVLHNFENELRTKDGTLRDVVSSVDIVEISGARHTLAFIDDITDRKRLQQAQGQLAAIVASSNDAIISKNLDGIITSWNSEAERIYGYRAEDVIGKSIAVLLPPDQHNDVQDILDGIKRHEHIHYETIRQHKAGHLLNMSLTISPIYDETRTIFGASIIAQDMTERKQIEKRQRQTQELEIELGKVQEVMALKERFISMVSHEFRTPLAIIKLASDVLSTYNDQLSTDMRNDKFKQIHDQIQHMTELLEDVLSLTKVKSGKLQFERELLDLEGTCQEVVEELRSTLLSDQQLNFACHGNCRSVRTDEQLIRQILINLLSNAIKYSPPNTTIECSLFEQTGAVKLVIRDSGIGIPETDKAHLFEPFFRAMNVGNRLGTGLGLAIVRENIDAYGGSIEFESAEGEGTTFTVTLPTDV